MEQWLIKEKNLNKIRKLYILYNISAESFYWKIIVNYRPWTILRAISNLYILWHYGSEIHFNIILSRLMYSPL